MGRRPSEDPPIGPIGARRPPGCISSASGGETSTLGTSARFHPATCVAASADLEIAAKSFPKYVGCRGVVRSRPLIERLPEFRVEAHRQ